jgi:hypothetical protein
VSHRCGSSLTAKDPFAINLFVARALLRYNHSKVLAESKPLYAVSIVLTAKQVFPVVLDWAGLALVD